MKKLKKIFIVFLLVFLLTGCTKQLYTEKTNSSGKKQKTVVRYTKGKNATGQALTKNIICKPNNEELIKLYNKNKVNVNKLVECSKFKPDINKTEGVWDNIFIKPLSWLILKLGYLVKNFGLAVILAGIVPLFLMLSV